MVSIDAAELEHPDGLRRKLIRNLTLTSREVTAQECAWLVRAALPLHMHMRPIDSMQLLEFAAKVLSDSYISPPATITSPHF